MIPATLNKPATINKERVRQARTLPLSFSSRKTYNMNRKLSNVNRILLVIFSALMALAYFFPLWDITLEAPQYPEGLGLEIWINRIGGQMDIINGLNHYIGMKHIDPASFPELVLMPYLVGGIIGFGLLSALINKKYMLLAFAIIVLVAGIVGGVDFYLWEYDYGHNLDPRAAIKVPGMTYQPPMFGSKELLNFTAIAWPGIGGLSIIAAGIGIVIITIYELRRKSFK